MTRMPSPRQGNYGHPVIILWPVPGTPNRIESGMKKCCVIEAPSNLGLKEPGPGKKPGVNKLPAWLKAQGLYEKLSPDQIITVAPPPYSMHLDEVSGVRNAGAIAAYSKQLSLEIQHAVTAGYFPVVLGGDCSILIGCAHALKSKGKYGLFFMDGHTDFVRPHTSLTKGAAGMDLAIVTGHAHNKLANIGNLKPYFEEKDTLAFGNRYLQQEYVSMIRNSSIAYYDLEGVREKGIENITRQFLNQLNNEQANGFWIHLDADVLDDELMPCVDSRQPGGLRYDELRFTLELLLSSGLARGIDITILDPDLDENGVYTKRFVDELSVVFSV